MDNPDTRAGASNVVVDPRLRPRSSLARRIGMGILIAGCLVMSVVGGVLPILQGWIFFVIGLYLLATEFVVGRRLIIWARRRWPKLSDHIRAAAEHRWAPRHLREFVELTDPGD